MNSFIYFDEVDAYTVQGYYECFAPSNGPLIGMYHPGKGLYVKVVQRDTYIEFYHPDMDVCQGTIPTPAGEIPYTSYPEYIQKIEEAFARALQGWHS